jgi:hypothetical protein
MAQRKAYLSPSKFSCSLCGGNVQKLLVDRGGLTAPVDVFDYSLDIAPTLTRAVCGHGASEVAAAHAALVEGLTRGRSA